MVAALSDGAGPLDSVDIVVHYIGREEFVITLQDELTYLKVSCDSTTLENNYIAICSYNKTKLLKYSHNLKFKFD